MLGKHNFKERLRKMEKQDKHDRFSIRKLTIGAASVLIGFAFMGLNISSVQASSNPLDQIKEEEQSNSNKEKSNSDQNDQAKPQINLEQNKKPQLAGQNNNQTGNENQSTKNDKQPANKQDQASQKAKADAAKTANDQVKAGASEAKGSDQAKSSVNKSASAAGNKTNEKSAQAPDASSAAKQATQEQDGKADSAQGKTETGKTGQENSANKENNKSDAAEAKDKQDLKTADLLKGKNNLSTDKNSSDNKDITSSINKLKAELDQANALEKSDNFKSIDQAKQNQLETLVKQANEMMQNYQTQELGISLLELPEEQNKNKKNGIKADSGTQSFDVGKLKGLTGSLSGLLSSLAYIPGQAGQNVDNWNELKQALNDASVARINLQNNITLTDDFAYTGTTNRNVTIYGTMGENCIYLNGHQFNNVNGSHTLHFTFMFSSIKEKVSTWNELKQALNNNYYENDDYNSNDVIVLTNNITADSDFTYTGINNHHVYIDSSANKYQIDLNGHQFKLINGTKKLSFKNHMADSKLGLSGINAPIIGAKVATWNDLKNALNNSFDGETVDLTGNITANSDFAYTGTDDHNVIIDGGTNKYQVNLNGHKFNTDNPYTTDYGTTWYHILTIGYNNSKISEKVSTWNDLTQALNNSFNGEIITLTGNITADSDYSRSGGLYQNITIYGGTNKYQIDLNGHKFNFNHNFEIANSKIGVKVGTWNDLTQALNNSFNGETITLTGNITADSNYNYSGSSYHTVTIDGGTNKYKIDLNSHQFGTESSNTLNISTNNSQIAHEVGTWNELKQDLNILDKEPIVLKNNITADSDFTYAGTSDHTATIDGGTNKYQVDLNNHQFKTTNGTHKLTVNITNSQLNQKVSNWNELTQALNNSFNGETITLAGNITADSDASYTGTNSHNVTIDGGTNKYQVDLNGHHFNHVNGTNILGMTVKNAQVGVKVSSWNELTQALNNSFNGETIILTNNITADSNANYTGTDTHNVTIDGGSSNYQVNLGHYQFNTISGTNDLGVTAHNAQINAEVANEDELQGALNSEATNIKLTANITIDRPIYHFYEGIDNNVIDGGGTFDANGNLTGAYSLNFSNNGIISIGSEHETHVADGFAPSENDNLILRNLKLNIANNSVQSYVFLEMDRDSFGTTKPFVFDNITVNNNSPLMLSLTGHMSGINNLHSQTVMGNVFSRNSNVITGNWINEFSWSRVGDLNVSGAGSLSGRDHFEGNVVTHLVLEVNDNTVITGKAVFGANDAPWGTPVRNNDVINIDSGDQINSVYNFGENDYITITGNSAYLFGLQYLDRNYLSGPVLKIGNNDVFNLTNQKSGGAIFDYSKQTYQVSVDNGCTLQVKADNLMNPYQGENRNLGCLDDPGTANQAKNLIISDGGTFIGDIKNYNGTTLTTAQPKLVEFKFDSASDTPSSLGTSSANLNLNLASNQDLDLHAVRANNADASKNGTKQWRLDATHGHGPIKIISNDTTKNDISSIYTYQPGILADKTREGGQPDNDIASYVYKVDGASADKLVNSLDLNNDKFKDLRIGLNALVPTDAGRYDASSNVVAHGVDESGQEVLPDASGFVTITDSTITTTPGITPVAGYNVVYGKDSHSAADERINPTIKWIKGLITAASANNYNPRNESTSSPVVSTEQGLITVDSTGKATLNTSSTTTGIDGSNATIEVDYADGTKDYVPVIIKLANAKAKNGAAHPAASSSATNPINPVNADLMNGSAITNTNDATTGKDTNAEAENLIANAGNNRTSGSAFDDSLGQFHATYTFVDDDGNALTAFPTDATHSVDIAGDATHKADEVNVKVSYWRNNGGNYVPDGSQIVKNIWLKVKKSQADTFNDFHANGSITAHVVNTGDVTHYQNGLIGTDTSVSYTKADGTPTTGALSSIDSDITGVTWETNGTESQAPDVSQITSSPETRTAVVTFSDHSTAKVDFKVTVIGASASSPNQSVVSGKQPSAAQAKAAINNADANTGAITLSGLPSGTTATVDGWVNATETGGKYNVATTPANYSITWSSATGAANTATGYVRIHYSDGTDQIVPVTLNINSLASSVDPNKSEVKDFNVHANATSADPTSHLTLKNGSGDTLTGWTFKGWTTRTGTPGAYIYSDVPATGTHDLASYLNDSSLINGTKTVTLYAKVKMTADHSIYYVPKAFTLTVVGAVAKGSATTDHGTALTANAQLQNYSTLHDDFGSDITSVDWTDANGNAVDASTYWKNNTDNDHATNPSTSVRINGSKDAYITVKYSDGTHQTVWIPLKIKSDLDKNGSNITLSANSKDVHYGQALSDADARGLLENNGRAIAAGDISATDSTKEFKFIQWVDDLGNVLTSGPVTIPTTIGTTGENDVAAHIKITFQDDSYITKDVTIKVHSGYKNADQHLTITSGDKPSDDDAKAAIYNANDLSSNYHATSFAWAQDADGTAMTKAYVTDGTNNDTKHAWVVITYTDGAGVTKKQIVQVNDLTIHNMANGLIVDHVTGGFNYHAVSTGSPDPNISSDDLKGYFTIKDGTADASADVTGAAWTTGHIVDWTKTDDQAPQVTLTFTDGSSKSYELPTKLVAAKVDDPTYTVNRNDVPDSNAAKGMVSNASDLSTYNPTYGWYSDADGTTALAAADVAAPTPAGSPKTVYLKVDYHKGSATGTADGYEIISIQLTVQNSSANYRAGLKAGVSGLTLHVDQPNSDFEGPGFFGNNISNLITIAKRSDGSVVSPTDGSIIGSITWGNNSAGRSTEPSTAANAPSSQTGEVVVIFRDDTASNPDRITVNVPVTILKATAKSDISTNHDHALTASDEISNLTDLNNGNLNFSAPAADVTWAKDTSGTALDSNFWTTNSDNSHTTDPSGNTLNGVKGAYLIVHYKKGTADDGTQAIWVPVKIKSDKDNNGDNITLSADSTDVHYGQSLSDADARGLLKNNNNPIAAGDVSNSDTSKEFKSIQWVDGSGNVLTSGPVTIPTTIGTTGENDVAAHIKITFQDDSYITKDVTIKVHSGYNNTNHTENVVSGAVPSDDDAKAAIANATDLINHYHAISFAWAQDADGTAMTKAYVTDGTNNDTKHAWVKITYTDGATTVTQVVKVNDLKITNQANHYTPEPTENSEGQANGVVTHVNGSIDMSTLPIRFKYTDAAGNIHYNSLSDIGATVAWQSTTDKPDLTKDSNGAHDFPVIITYADGSTSSTTSPYKISVNVIGAKAKASASTNHDHPLTASDEIDNLSTLSRDFNVASGDISWTDASGNPIDSSTYWHDNTDGDHATNPTTNDRINGSKDAYITVKYGDGTHQTVWIPLKINSEADNVDPETGIIFAHNDRSVTVHADSHSADLTNHNITVIETTTGTHIPYNTATSGTPNGWTFGGWATRDSSTGAYTLISGTALDTDLNDHNLDVNGKKDVPNSITPDKIYAVINLPDHSTLYTPAMTIHVLGAVGQNVAFNHADAVPDATTTQDLNGNTAITNATALNNQFGTVTYTWMKKQGSTWVEMTADDFNHREVNEPVIVRVKYGSDTNTQDVKLNLTIHDDSDEINTDKTNAASSGDYNTHVGAKINGSDNFGNVDLKNAISFRDANNHPLFLDNTGAPTWTFAGFVNSANSTTPIDVNVTNPVLTNGYKDNTNLYAYIKLHDGSYTHVKMNHVKVYGGYEQKTGSGASAVYPTTAGQDTTTLANKDLTDEQAQAAIANSSTLNGLFSATGATALTYEWSTDGIHTGAGYKPDVSYNEISDNHKVRTASVIITYGDGTKQAVQVHYNVKSLADHVDPETGIKFAGNDRSDTVHADSPSADPSSHITLIETTTGIVIPRNTAASGHAPNGWVFSGWTTRSGSAGAYTYTPITDHDLKDSLSDSHLDNNGKHDVTDRYAEITLVDGSKLYTPAMTIHVLGAVGQNVAFNHADTVPDATTTQDLNGNTAIKNATALNNQFGTVTYTWMKNTGTVASPHWVDMTANDFNKHEESEPVIVRVKYGNDTNTQDVHLNLTIRSDADQINTDKTNAASSREYNTHIGAKINGPTNFGNVDLKNAISFRDANNDPMFVNAAGNPTWHFNGFVTASTVGGVTTYSPHDVDLSAADLTDGVDDITDLYADIKLPDHSDYYIKMNHVKVYGGYEAKTTTGSGASAVTTYPTTAAQDPTTDANKALTSEQAQAAIADSSTLNGLFKPAGQDALKYEWSDNGTDTGAGHQPDVKYVAGASGIEGQEKGRTAYVIITYGDGTTQSVQVHYNVKSMADRIDPDNTNAASSGNYNTHIGANINGSANFGNVDLKNAISFRDANNNPMFIGSDGNPTWQFAGFVDSATGTTPTDVDMNTADLTNGVHDLTNLYAYIKLPDGSYTHVKMNHVKVYGGYEAKTTTGSGASAVTTYPTTAAQDPTTGANKALTSEQAQDAIANSSTLNSLFSPTGATALKYEWSDNGTDTGAGHQPDVNYNETSDNSKVRTAYVIITYGDGTKQAVQVYYNVKSLADRVDPSHTDDYNASHTVYDTHVNADILTPGSVDLSNSHNFDGNNGIKFEDSEGHDITSSVTDWTFVGWKTKSGNTYNDATASDIDVTDSGLTNGTKNANASDGKIYAALKMSDGSTVYVQMKNIKVYGGYTDAASASVVPGTDLSTTTSQNAAKGDITNSSTLSTKFSNSSNPVKYEWKKQSGSGASLSYADIPVTDTTLAAGQTSKTLAASDGYGILITYGDGKTQFVKKDIQIATSDGEANNSRLSGTTITVEEYHTLTNGKNNDGSAPSDAQRAVVVNSVGSGASASTSLPAGTSFAFVGTVDTRYPGEKAAIVRVTYPDNSATKPDTYDVHVIVKVLSQAQEYNPAGRDLTVNRNANVNRNDSTPESADAVRAKDGISNVSALPNNAKYSWAGANPDVSQAGSVVPAVIKVTYHDGSSDLVHITIHVNGIDSTSLASRFDPQGQDLRVHTGANISDPLHVQDSHRATSDPTSAIANAADMPSGTTYSWVTEPDTASVGTKTGVIKVTFSDHSTKSLGVNVIVWNDASISTAPTGQNIHITSGQALNPSDGIANKTDLSHVASSNGYTFTTTPSNINNGTAAVTKPTAVIVHYVDGSQSAAVPIFVTVDPVTAPGTTPTDAERYHARGTTIVRDMNPSASLTAIDAHDAVVVDASGESAVQGYAWVNDDFKNTALHSSGLKAGYVKITFNDNSTATVLAYVDVKSASDRYAEQISGKTTRVPLGTAASDSRLAAQNNVSGANSMPSGTTYAWIETPSTDNLGTFPETVRVSFTDGSHIDVATTLVVYDNRRDNQKYVAHGQTITKHIGDVLDNNDAKQAIANSSSLASHLSITDPYIWKVGATPSTATEGLKTGIVTVKFADGSTQDVNVLVNVLSYADDPTYAPIGKDVTIGAPSSTPLTGAGTGSGAAKNGIANAGFLANVVASPTAPSNPAQPYTWVGSVDISKANTTKPAIIKVTYKDGSSRLVGVNVIVGHLTSPNNSGTTVDPQAKVINVDYGQVFENNSTNAAKGIANTNKMPSGATYQFVSPLPVDSSNKINQQSGDVPILIRITANGYDKTIATTIHITSDADRYDPQPDPITIDPAHPSQPSDPTRPRDNDHPTNPTPGVTPGSVPTGTTTTWPTDPSGNPIVPPTTPGSHTTTIVVHFPDGSTKTIPTNVVVPDNGSHPGAPGRTEDTDNLNPYGITITRHKNNLNNQTHTLSDDDAYDAVKFPAGQTPTSGTTYQWADSNFSQNVLNYNSGTYASTVRVTYHDGSIDLVSVNVRIITDADGQEPTPVPITIDPANPSQPSDPTRPRDNSNPSNPIPGVDPGSVPTGTTTTWPTVDPSGNPVDPHDPNARPVVPNTTTPGTHPSEIVIHYPDGSTRTIPTIIVVPEPAVTPAPSESNYVAPAPDEDHDLVFFDPENNDQVVKTLPDEIVGAAETDLPADSLRDLIATNIPDGYVLAPSFRITDMFMPTDTSAMRIPVLRRRLVFVTKQGKKKVVVAAVFGVVHGKQWSIISKSRMTALIKKYMPKGYKLANLYKIERTMITDHRDIEIPVQKKAKRHVRKTARHAKRHVARRTKRR